MDADIFEGYDPDFRYLVRRNGEDGRGALFTPTPVQQVKCYGPHAEWWLDSRPCFWCKAVA